MKRQGFALLKRMNCRLRNMESKKLRQEESCEDDDDEVSISSAMTVLASNKTNIAMDADTNNMSNNVPELSLNTKAQMYLAENSTAVCYVQKTVNSAANKGCTRSLYVWWRRRKFRTVCHLDARLAGYVFSLTPDALNQIMPRPSIPLLRGNSEGSSAVLSMSSHPEDSDSTSASEFTYSLVGE